MTSSDLDITDTVLAELRSASDIVEVIGDHTRLKKAGRSWKGLCPFHNERTPSFTVDRDKGLYHCFGCGAGGDVIHFVRQIDRLEFPEAVEALAARFGVTIPRRQRRGPRDDRRDRLFEALAAAQRFYAERLARPGNEAAKYLEARGVPPEMWKALGLGFAPDAWDSLSSSLSGAFTEELLVEAGLLQARAEGKGAYDRFRDRLLFVVKDERGRPVGFGGRALSSQGEPKYLNSPESPVFSKKRLLYGLFEAREAVRRRERVVLVEGYFDHLALVRAGIGETVASMGTALTPEQTERLRRLAPRAIVCYDGDAAGRKATHGALVHLLSQGFEAAVARLPEGEDPDDLLRGEGPESLARRIDEAPDYLTWLLEDVRPDEGGISRAERSQRIESVADIVRQIPNSIRRYEEFRKLSTGVAMLPEELVGTSTPKRREQSAPADRMGTLGNSSVLSMSLTERALLRGLFGGGELKAMITNKLRLEWLTSAAAKRIAETFRGPETIDFQQSIGHLTEEDRVLVAAIDLEDSTPPTRKGIEQHLSRLEEAYIESESRDLQAAIGRAQAEGRPQSEIDALARKKQDIKRRDAQLKRKGTELGD